MKIRMVNFSNRLGSILTLSIQKIDSILKNSSDKRQLTFEKVVNEINSQIIILIMERKKKIYCKKCVQLNNLSKPKRYPKSFYCADPQCAYLMQYDDLSESPQFVQEKKDLLFQRADNSESSLPVDHADVADSRKKNQSTGNNNKFVELMQLSESVPPRSKKIKKKPKAKKSQKPRNTSDYNSSKRVITGAIWKVSMKYLKWKRIKKQNFMVHMGLANKDNRHPCEKRISGILGYIQAHKQLDEFYQQLNSYSQMLDNKSVRKEEERDDVVSALRSLYYTFWNYSKFDIHENEEFRVEKWKENMMQFKKCKSMRKTDRSVSNISQLSKAYTKGKQFI